MGRSLFHNGKIFLRDVFRGEDELAEAVNRLLLAGFYLVNIGLVLLTSSLGSQSGDAMGQYRTLTVKLGFVALLLGTMHFVNLAQLSSARRRRLNPTPPPPPKSPYGPPRPERTAAP